jgi:hypothetical protein
MEAEKPLDPVWVVAKHETEPSTPLRLGQPESMLPAPVSIVFLVQKIHPEFCSPGQSFRTDE